MDGVGFESRIAARLLSLRGERGWSLDEAAKSSGISRATLSRLEKGDVSPTASVLNRICAAYGLTMSRLMTMVEEGGPRLVRREEQHVWHDRGSGFARRSVSPPGSDLAGEAIEGSLGPGSRIDYERTPRAGIEHHLVMLEGSLSVTLDGEMHDLRPGDCLRYRLFGPSSFGTPAGEGARYLLFMV